MGCPTRSNYREAKVENNWQKTRLARFCESKTCGPGTLAIWSKGSKGEDPPNDVDRHPCIESTRSKCSGSKSKCSGSKRRFLCDPCFQKAFLDSKTTQIEKQETEIPTCTCPTTQCTCGAFEAEMKAKGRIYHPVLNCWFET